MKIELLTLFDYLCDIVLDKPNIINVIGGYLTAYVWIMKVVGVLTPIIAFVSITSLCVYNVINLYRKIKNKE